MTYRKSCGAAGQILLMALLVGLFHFPATAKVIRLRNGPLDTDAASNRAEMTSAMKSAENLSGLYLIQFSTQLEPSQHAQLKLLGVELLQYVPEDAFVARFSRASASSLAALPFVQWVGTYHPQYKIHPRLSQSAALAAQTNATVQVNVLVSTVATPAEMAELRSHLGAVYHESHLRQGTFIRAELLPGHLGLLSQSSAVLWLEHAPKRKLVDEAASKLVGGDDGRVATPTVTEQLGFNGSGVTVCIADTGLDSGDTNTMHPDLFGRVTGFQPYGSIIGGSDGYGHGTHCAGIVAGNAATGETDPDSGAFYGLGVASGASLFIERIFDDQANEASPFPSDETLTHDAVRHGAKVGSNSWGNDVQGEYDTDCAQFDELVRDADAGTVGDQPYILEFSAGNAGPNTQTIGSPACAKNVIATGASENIPGTIALTYGLYADGPDTMADFSSRGPCADGRIKPDLVAPGTWIASAASSAAPNEASVSWLPIDQFYVYMGGTSMSGPHAAGAAAVFVQYYRSTHGNATPSPALVKAALINSADELDEMNGGPSPVPNNDEGWGRITLTNIVVTNLATASRMYQYVDQTVLLTNGQVYVQHVFVEGADQPLKVTLAYTDLPGFPGALPALVNDLDLEVVGPDGTLYRGNQFGAGESVPNPPSPDRLNNVEGVYLSAPTPGDYAVRVRATRIVQDSISSTTAVDQDFALVASGNLTRPGVGIVLLDRPSYTAPGMMQLQVLDAARAASPSVNVVVTNLTAHRGLTTLLRSSGNYGAFTGTVATVTGVAGSGQLQIAGGDSLEADYVDTTATKRVATAYADLIAPGISGVTVSTELGVLTITWQTSEPSTSLVRYGTNSANLNFAVTNLALVTTHTIKLTRLIPGATYYFVVSSTDPAGNIATSDNGGTYYNFIGVAPPIVLLVDAYDTAVESNNGATVIPDSSYTNVLTSAGISYAFWKVNARGSPQLSDLSPFPVVIWRLTDDIINYGVDADGLPDPNATNNTLTAQQQFMIQSYLNGGGSFFMASMGVLSQLGGVPFRRDVLQVGEFVQNPDPPAPCSDCDEDFGVPAIVGGPSGLGSGLAVTLDYSLYPSFDDGFGDVYGPDFSDTFTPMANATPMAFESVSGKPCAMSYPNVGVDSPGRVVFMSFPFDAVPTSGPGQNNAIALLKSIVRFLAPGANGLGVVMLDNTVYTTNDVITVEMGDSDLIGTGQTTISFAASSRTNQTTIALYETTHPGLFKGYITLVAGTAGPNQLQVQNGDIVTGSYFDVSNGSNQIATATVDTVPPVISQVAATTDYYNARVSWLTSKPADSTVQYSESPLPDHSAFLAALITNHVVTISGLVANRQYYYQVVSRDQAGNTVVDDNHGNLYSFQTMKAPSPPWNDTLETGAPGWTVVPDPSTGSDLNWTLGTPANGLATSAYSGTHAWGSDLNGDQSFFFASSYLYSPVIDLSGLSSATLRFMNVFDFTRVDPTFGSYEEDGGVFISTNSSVPPSLNLPLAVEYAGSVANTWTQEIVDLTPWVGQTIQVVFYYQAIAGGDQIYGWTIDNVQITGVTSGGNITVNKNLGQGIWSLSSLTPLGTVPIHTDTKTSATINNLPAGRYVVSYGDVPYYQTPPDQTNNLGAGGSLSFNGNYSFLDVNHNGISDSWEAANFGSVTTNRNQLTDSDGDGMTDYEEFIAGTDPNNAASRFYLSGATTPTNGVAQVQWTVVTNRLYQLDLSTNLTTWVPLTDWLQASNSATMTYTPTNSGGGFHFYRVQVKP